VKEKVTTGVRKEQWRVLNYKVVGMIWLYINHNVLHHVTKDTNTYEMWQKLESIFESKTSMNKASVIKNKLAKLEYWDGSSVTKHLNVFKWHINQLSTMKNNFEDEVKELLLLSSMPDSWNTLIASVSNLALDVKLTSEMVKNSMLNGEYRKNKKRWCLLISCLCSWRWPNKISTKWRPEI
jgi:hypothetical protein